MNHVARCFDCEAVLLRDDCFHCEDNEIRCECCYWDIIDSLNSMENDEREGLYAWDEYPD